MSEPREPYLVLGQEVEPEVPLKEILKIERLLASYHPNPYTLFVIERRHLDRIIELLAAAWGYAEEGKTQEARNLLDQVLTVLEDRTWASL